LTSRIPASQYEKEMNFDIFMKDFQTGNMGYYDKLDFTEQLITSLKSIADSE
jgi:hypothetical protein